MKEHTKHAYICTNGFFLSKGISKERQTNFERTLFDQTTYPGLIKSDYKKGAHTMTEILLCLTCVVKQSPVERTTCLVRDRSFDRITFFRNSSVVLSKFVSKEKNRSFKYRHVLYVLLNSVLSKIFQFSKEWYSNKKMLI